MICEKCGEPIAQDALYCENCGARAALQADAAQARSASARKIRRRRMLPGPGGSAAAQSVKKCRLPTLPSRRKI